MVYHGTKRRVFFSFYKGDTAEVDQFINYWGNREGVFTPYVLGAGDNDDFINSTNTEYVMSQIRARYIKDSTVTIVLLGSCTHSRRYVDWEIKASLRQGNDGLPNGLLGIILPSSGTSVHLPERFEMNWEKGEDNCYALFRSSPSSSYELGSWIDDAFDARRTRADLIRNPQEMWSYNHTCEVHGITH